MVPALRCVACGADLSGRYCAECGEPAAHHDYSLKHFAEEALETFAHIDGRVFSTLSDNFIEMTTSAIVGVPFMMYLFAASGRAYGESWWRTAFKTLLLSGWTLA